MQAIALRPEPGLSATLRAGRAAGLAIEGFPLADVEPVAPDPVPRGDFDALVLGSANAVRHGGRMIAEWRGRPAYVVGEATAEAARAADLAIAGVGEGGLQQLLDAIAPEFGATKLLRLAGERHLALELPPAIEMRTCVVYRVVYRPLPPALVRALAEGGAVLLHSGEMARHLAAECDRRGIDRAGLALAALAPRVARAAGEGWREVAVAPTPSDGALLALARDMCH